MTDKKRRASIAFKGEGDDLQPILKVTIEIVEYLKKTASVSDCHFSANI